MKLKLLTLLVAVGFFAFGANAAEEKLGANASDMQKSEAFEEKVNTELKAGVDPISAVCTGLKWVSGDKCKVCKTATDIATCLKTEGPALVGKACHHMCGGTLCTLPFVGKTTAAACKMVCCPYQTDAEVKACFDNAKITCDK